MDGDSDDCLMMSDMDEEEPVSLEQAAGGAQGSSAGAGPSASATQALETAAGRAGGAASPAGVKRKQADAGSELESGDAVKRRA